MKPMTMVGQRCPQRAAGNSGNKTVEVQRRGVQNSSSLRLCVSAVSKLRPSSLGAVRTPTPYHHGITIALLLLVFLFTLTHGAEPPTKPNVILIVTDDQGAGDAGCYGAKDLVTPNIDALAARGVQFTQFYA